MDTTVTALADIWKEAQKRIASEIDDNQVYDSFFSSTKINGAVGKTLYVAVNSPVAVQVLTKSYTPMVNRVIRDVTQSDYSVEFVEEGDKAEDNKKNKETTSFFKDSVLDPKFTFENFVEGDSNRAAYQAALMAAKAPAGIYNPLFIYGGSGLGKTHLLTAIGNAYKARFPGKEVLYVTADGFFDEYVKFVTGEKRGDELRGFFRDRVDMLLVDDVQFLKGRRNTEETFFSIFNMLISLGRQVVLTSDTHPSKMEGFSSRLLTRFAQGLTLSVNPPDQETSERILRTKIKAYGLDESAFDPEIIPFFAKQFSSNVRELEGRLVRLIFFMTGHPSKTITLEEAKRAVQDDIEAKEEDTKISEEKIVNTVADFFYLSPAQITGRNRTGQIALARHIAMYLIRNILDLPFAKIGEYFGGKDHATVMNGVQKVEKTLKTDADLRKTVSTLKAKLKG